MNRIDEFSRQLLAQQHAAQQLGRVLTAGVQPWIDQHKRMVEQLRPILEAHEQMRQRMQPVVEALTRQVQPAIESLKVITGTVAPFAKQMREMNESLRSVLTEVHRAFHDLPPRQRHALGLFAQNGWYLDSELALPDLWEISELFETGEAPSAHDRLCDHFEARLDDIEQHLVSEHQKRTEILSQAFDAHRRGHFAMSTMAFLSQADGICFDLVGEQLYRRRGDGPPRLAEHLDIDNQLPFNAALLYPLTQPMPITANANERAALTDALHRHPVIHGESVDYGTRLNSYRALSLLVYVAWILARHPDRSPAGAA